jgi:hypothetical protein
MLRTLLAHPQEALHKRHLVYCVRTLSVGCGMTAVKLKPCHSRVAPPEDGQVMLEKCTGP